MGSLLRLFQRRLFRGRRPVCPADNAVAAAVGFSLERLEPRVLLNGVTLITHGRLPDSERPQWLDTMKDAVVSRAGAYRIYSKISNGTNTRYYYSPATLNVLPIIPAFNTAPTFTATDPVPSEEDSGDTYRLNWAAFDPGDPTETDQTATHTVSQVSNPSLFAVPPSVSADGLLSYRAAPDAYGTSTFEVVVKDSGGTANGGIDTSAPQTFTITVHPSDDRPSLFALNPPLVLRDAGPQTLPAWATFSPGPANESHQTVVGYTVGEISNPELFAVAPAVGVDGTLTYTPASGASGTSTFRVTVQDNGTVAYGGIDESFPVTFSVTVADHWLAPDAKNRLTYVDGAGKTVQVQLTGPGSFAVAMPAGVSGDALEVRLAGTTGKSALTISAARGVTTKIKGIRVGSSENLASLKSITAKAVDLDGDLVASGSVGTITLGNLVGAHVVNIGPSIDPKATLTLQVGLASTTLLSAIPIKSITAKEWGGVFAFGGAIVAPSIGSLRITGDAKAGVFGDFGASLFLNRNGITNPRTPTLGSVSVKGFVLNSEWRIAGDVGTIAAGDFSSDWRATVTGSIKSATSKDDFGGSIEALSIDSITAGSQFSGHLLLTRAADALGRTFGLKSLKAGGSIEGAVIRAAGNIGTISTGTISESNIYAGVRTDLWDLPGSIDDFVDRRASIGTVTMRAKAYGEPSYWWGATIAAPKIKRVSLRNIEIDTGGTPRGLAAESFGSFTTGLPIPPSGGKVGDFEVRLVKAS